MNLNQLKELLNDIVSESLTSRDLLFHTVSIPEEATEESIIFLSNEKYYKKIPQDFDQSKTLFIINEKFESVRSEKSLSLDNVIVVKSIEKAIHYVSKHFYDEVYSEINFDLDGRKSGKVNIHPEADIAPDVFIGEDVVIGAGVKLHPGVVIQAKVSIGEGTIIYPNTVVYPLTSIGKNCRIHSQCTIGGDGFGYNFADGEHLKVWHFGGVEIGDKVEIGGNTCVDIGAFTKTQIGEGTKIDNFCQISHNSKVGKHCVFCGRSGVSGSCTIEDYVIFGAGAGAAPGVYLKTGTQVAACAIISENAIWGPKEVLAGHPAQPLKEYMRTQAKLRILAKK